MYTYIINPKNQLKYKLYSKKGKQLLKKYIQLYNLKGGENINNIINNLKIQKTKSEREIQKLSNQVNELQDYIEQDEAKQEIQLLSKDIEEEEEKLNEIKNKIKLLQQQQQKRLLYIKGVSQHLDKNDDQEIKKIKEIARFKNIRNNIGTFIGGKLFRI